MRKLIANATAPNLDDVDDNKRKVRISNPNKHIQAAVNDMNGALDVMFSVGFIMSEDEVDSETYLVYPPGDAPSWLTAALQRMAQYESGCLPEWITTLTLQENIKGPNIIGL